MLRTFWDQDPKNQRPGKPSLKCNKGQAMLETLICLPISLLTLILLFQIFLMAITRANLYYLVSESTFCLAEGNSREHCQKKYSELIVSQTHLGSSHSFNLNENARYWTAHLQWQVFTRNQELMPMPEKLQKLKFSTYNISSRLLKSAAVR